MCWKRQLTITLSCFCCTVDISKTFDRVNCWRLFSNSGMGDVINNNLMTDNYDTNHEIRNIFMSMIPVGYVKLLMRRFDNSWSVGLSVKLIRFRSFRKSLYDIALLQTYSNDNIHWLRSCYNRCLKSLISYFTHLLIMLWKNREASNRLPAHRVVCKPLYRGQPLSNVVSVSKRCLVQRIRDYKVQWQLLFTAAVVS